MAQDRPTSELLRFLAEFYDSRNLISTANRLGKGSATCFRLLAQAREIFEDPLFVKSGRAMMPTPKMDSLIGEIQSILMRIDRLPSPKVFSPKNLTQDFRIGCIDNAALRFIVPSLANLFDQAPNIRLSIISLHEHFQWALEKGNIDIVIYAPPNFVSETVRGAGAVFVNKEGKRFISELTTRDKTSAAVSKQTGGVAYEIFDQKVRDKVKQTGAAFELGLAKEGRTLEELGKNAGIDPKNLAATIAQYNKYAEAGNDPEFGRPKISAKVDTPNFYAIEVTPAIHYYMGGLKINPQAKVIDKNGKVIEGLFAAGEVTGGVHGKNRLGGNSISETITFGRISGEEAAKRIANN